MNATSDSICPARLAGTLSARLIMPVAAAVLMAGCSEQDYEVVSERDTPSPDGRFLASVMEDTCFNTTGYQQHIGLRRKGERQPDSRHVWHFGPDDHVAVAWTSPTNLLVRYGCPSGNHEPSFTNVFGVTVTFERVALERMWAERDARATRDPAVSAEAQRTRPVVSQVHVISVHVKDPATFDAVFLFLRDLIQLPLVYGELSKPGESDQRFYAGFSVGNAYLEPCGPYKSDPPFSADQPARFHGLTFSLSTPIADAAIALGEKGLAHSEVMGDGNHARFVYLTDPVLTAPKVAVSLWEIQNPQNRANLGFLKASLQEAKGGALGVKGIEEVRIEFREPANLDPWNTFLGSAQQESGVWRVGGGPALRFAPGNETQITAIVLRVESLEKATTVLSQRGLVGRVTPTGIELDPARVWGLRITLKEA